MADDSAILSDVDDDEDLSSSSPPATAASSTTADHRLRDLQSELEQERQLRRAAEESLKSRDVSLSRLKAFAQDIIKKRDEISAKLAETLKERDDAIKERDDVTKERDEAIKEIDGALKERDGALRERESVKSEAETASQLMASGIDMISGKVARFRSFDGFPRSQKYATGLPAVAYGAIKRANDIVDEMTKQLDSAAGERDRAQQQIEHRNYEIAIEVSQLEAAIAGLKDEVSEKEKTVIERGAEISEMGKEISEMRKEISEVRQFGEEKNARLKDLEARMESQRPVIIDQLSNISKTFEKVSEIVDVADGGSVSDQHSSFVWEEMDMDRNLQALSEGIVSVYKTAEIAVEKVRGGLEEKERRISVLEEKVNGLVAEKQHIGTLLRSALSSKTNEVLQVAESGLREAGIELRFDGRDENGGLDGVEEDEVYTLAGALENTVKASKQKIVELQHLVEALRAESSLHKAHLDAQTKEISQLKLQIKELEKKELVANESVEGLMTDIAAAEEEIARWKAAAEQEAAAGRAVEQEFLSQLSTLRQELEETKQTMSELENKLKFKEETAAAAMAARDAAVDSLRLADLRSSRLRERVEELSRQLEANDSRTDSRSNQNSHRYVCWPWDWLGLNVVRYQPDVQENNSNEMELSEPFI